MDDLRGLIGAQHLEVSLGFELGFRLALTSLQINNGPLNDGDYYHTALSHDSYSVLERDYFVASAVASPGSTADVQAIVRWANQWKIPLWPVSIGRNLGYGGAAPRVPGSIVLNMGKRMNQVRKALVQQRRVLTLTFLDLTTGSQRR